LVDTCGAILQSSVAEGRQLVKASQSSIGKITESSLLIFVWVAGANNDEINYYEERWKESAIRSQKGTELKRRSTSIQEATDIGGEQILRKPVLILIQFYYPMQGAQWNGSKDSET
jgi:hypothetical protein